MEGGISTLLDPPMTAEFSRDEYFFDFPVDNILNDDSRKKQNLLPILNEVE